jgi:tetratricopeptide (TPR) repeat protein
MPQTLTMLAYACAYGKAGQPEEGLRRLAEAAEIAEATQDRWAKAELCRVRGDLLLATGKALEAENSFRQALSVARRQNGRLWELRVAVSLARLWHSEGRNEEPRTLLQPIYGWFTTAVRTPDLEDAQELLGRLQLAPHDEPATFRCKRPSLPNLGKPRRCWSPVFLHGGTGGKARAPTIPNPCPVLAARNRNAREGFVLRGKSDFDANDEGTATRHANDRRMGEVGSA